MIKKKITIKLITPTFLYGFRQSEPEFRPPSFKGILRYWWRASNPNKDTKVLYEKEKNVFGGTTYENQKSKVKIIPIPNNHITKKNFFHMLQQPSLQKTVSIEGYPNKINVFNYLAYGHVSRDKQTNCLLPNQDIEFYIECDNDEVWKEVENTLKVIDAFGGIGAKSRNGFGSIKIFVDNQEFEYDIKKLFEALKNKNQDNKLNNQYRYTAFWKESKLWQTKTETDNWEESFYTIAENYIKAKLTLEKQGRYYKRSHLSSPVGKIKERKAKNYFLKIIKKNNSFKGQILYLPYKHNEINNIFNQKINLMEV